MFEHEIEDKKRLVASIGIPWEHKYVLFSYDTLRQRLLSGLAAVRTYKTTWKTSYLDYPPLMLKKHLLKMFLQRNIQEGKVSLSYAAKSILGISPQILRRLADNGLISTTHDDSVAMASVKYVDAKQLSKEIISPEVQKWFKSKRQENEKRNPRRINKPSWENLIIDDEN